MPTLETERMILRNIVESDIDDIYEYGRDPRVGPAASWKPHESREETQTVMEQIFLNKPFIFGMVLRETGHIVGTLGMMSDPHRENKHSLMLGYGIASRYWGLGLMTEAVRAVVDFVFQNPEIELITAYSFDFNTRSHRVLEKNGFQFEGLLPGGETRYDGQYFDLRCFSLLRPKQGGCG